MRDHLIAITPPKGSYQIIDVPFNREIMAVPGMERALWFWTCLPSAEAHIEARAIGLEVSSIVVAQLASLKQWFHARRSRWSEQRRVPILHGTVRDVGGLA